MTPLPQNGIVTTTYWAFTLTDGALRMLVVALSWITSLRLPVPSVSRSRPLAS